MEAKLLRFKIQSQILSVNHFEMTREREIEREREREGEIYRKGEIEMELTLNRYLPARLNSWRGQAAPCDAFDANECVAKTNWLSRGWPSIDRRVACQIYNGNNTVIHYGKSIRSPFTRQAHDTTATLPHLFHFHGHSLIFIITKKLFLSIHWSLFSFIFFFFFENLNKQT